MHEFADTSKTLRRGVTAGIATVSLLVGAAMADETAARDIVGKMATYLASQQTLSFDFDSDLQVATTDGQKLDIASSGSVAVLRPDKFHAKRRGGFSNVEVSFDGKTLTVLNLNSMLFAREDMPGSNDDMMSTMRDKYQRPLPAADLLSADVGKVLLAEVTDVKDLGSGVIGGEECDHIALRTREVDYQIWIAQGDQPHPCRFSVTNKTVAGSPDYTIEFSGWNSDPATADLTFDLPGEATQVSIGDIADLDDLAGIYAGKGAN